MTFTRQPKYPTYNIKALPNANIYVNEQSRYPTATYQFLLEQRYNVIEVSDKGSPAHQLAQRGYQFTSRLHEHAVVLGILIVT